MENKLSTDLIISEIVNFCIGKYKFIYITGNGASGKSTFAQSIISEINSLGLNANYIDTDDFLVDSTIRNSAKKSWTDITSNQKETRYTSLFKESYFIPAMETIIYSLKNNKDCYYKPKKQDKFIELKNNFSLTIIEGIGSTFLQKGSDVFGVFLTSSSEDEFTRRLERARNGESLTSFEINREKHLERNEQFKVNIEPEKIRFELELFSLNDFSLLIKKDSAHIFKDEISK